MEKTKGIQEKSLILSILLQNVTFFTHVIYMNKPPMYKE